jgi:hypothetical protein
MTSHYEFTVSVDVERVSGKFAPRDDIETALVDALDEAIGSVDLSGLGADGDSEYEVTDSSVNYSESK